MMYWRFDTSTAIDIIDDRERLISAFDNEFVIPDQEISPSLFIIDRRRYRYLVVYVGEQEGHKATFVVPVPSAEIQKITLRAKCANELIDQLRRDCTKGGIFISSAIKQQLKEYKQGQIVISKVYLYNEKNSIPVEYDLQMIDEK